MGRDKIEKYNYLTLSDILRAMPSIRLQYNPKGETWIVSSNRGLSTLKDVGLVILLDGTRVENNEMGNVLQMSADEIENVELLQPWQTLAYTWGALDGAIKITTRGAERSTKVSSKGVFYTSLGLTMATGKSQFRVAPGRYSLLLDIVSPMG